jgi:phosphate transport system substrate-binding protein
MTEDMATHPGGLTYALMANVTPNVGAQALPGEGGTCYRPNVANVYSHKYPFSRYVTSPSTRHQVNRCQGERVPQARLGKEGQQVVADERVFIPLQPEVVQEELRKLE